MDELDIDTWGQPQNVSRALIGQNNHMMTTWRSHDNKRRGSQFTAHKSPRPILFSCKKSRRDRAMPNAQNTIFKLAPIADYRMWDQFTNQILVVYRFRAPVWQLAKNSGTWIPCFRSQKQLLLCHSDFTVYARLPETVFDRCARRMRCIQHFKTGSAQLAILFPPYLWFNSVTVQSCPKVNFIFMIQFSNSSTMPKSELHLVIWWLVCRPEMTLAVACALELKYRESVSHTMLPYDTGICCYAFI